MLETNSKGEITGIRGPGNELYTKVSKHSDALSGNQNQSIKPSGRQYENLTGCYENFQYSGAGKNDWHYVTISEISSGTYEWKNRAEVSWTLVADKSDSLKVDDDCPYFEKGHKNAKLVKNKLGEITGILGPHGELYTKDFKDECVSVDINTLEGTYDCLLYQHVEDWH